MLKLPAMEADLNKNCAGWRPDALKKLEGAVEEDVHRLDDLRRYAVSPGATHESAIQNLLDYAQHLSNVTNRLEGFEAELKLEFFWCSAFNSTKKLVSGTKRFVSPQKHALYTKWRFCLL